MTGTRASIGFGAVFGFYSVLQEMGIRLDLNLLFLKLQRVAGSPLDFLDDGRDIQLSGGHETIMLE